MPIKSNNILNKFQKPLKDLVHITKNGFINIFTFIGVFLTSSKLLEHTFLKKYLENSQYLHSIGLTLNEFTTISFLVFLLYVLISFQTIILNSKIEEDIPITGDNQIKASNSTNDFKYNLATRKKTKITRIFTWAILGSLIVFLSIKLVTNNDDCDSKFGKFAIKICQFSDSYEKGGDEDEITVYIHNCLNQEINNDTIEVKKVLSQVKDGGIRNSVAEHYLQCFDKGIFAYGYRSTAQNTFFCNLYLKNIRNYNNTVRTSHGIIVLDDPKLISLKEVYKGKYISDFILGLYYYYNKEYEKAKDKFNSLVSAKLPNQMAAYSNMYLGYSKLLTKDSSGFTNLHLAVKLDPYNMYAKEINSEENQGYRVAHNKFTQDTLVNFKKTEITRLSNWPLAVVSVDKMNILYIGADNEIGVLANGVAPNRIKVILDSGTVMGSNGYYKLNLKKTGVDTLRIIEKTDNGVKKELYKKAFRVKYVPDPRVILAGKSTGYVNIKSLKSERRLLLNTDIEDLPYNIKFRIKRFIMSITMPREDAIIMSQNGNELSPIMKKALLNITEGSTIRISDVIVRDPNGVERVIDQTFLRVN